MTRRKEEIDRAREQIRKLEAAAKRAGIQTRLKK